MQKKLYYYSALMALFVAGCDSRSNTLEFAMLGDRPVATVYKVTTRSADRQYVACRFAPRDSARLRTRLTHGQLVTLVSADEGLIKRGDQYWLHVYPPFSHRPSCYIDIQYLIPFA